MYDPLIVDMFVKVYKQIAPGSLSLGPARTALNEITSSTLATATSTVSTSRLDDITASGDEMLTLFEMAGALAGNISLSDLGAVVYKSLRRLVPFSLLVLYAHDTQTDDLEATLCIGDSSSLIKGLRISLGQHLSGWVAANRQTIMNSDPVLDLGELARSTEPRLRNCLSTPLLSSENLVGVLTLYSVATDSFTEDHRRIIEVVSRQAAEAFKRLSEHSRGQTRDPLTGLPNIDHLEQLSTRERTQSNIAGESLALLMLDVVDLDQVNLVHGRGVGDEVLRHVARTIKAEVGPSNIVVRFSGNRFLALLSSADAADAEACSERIQAYLASHQLELRSGSIVPVELSIRCVSCPKDGKSLNDLLIAVHVVNPFLSNRTTSQIH